MFRSSGRCPIKHLYKIGRSNSCDIVLNDNSVSRKHAELLTLDDGRFYLTDCASQNGTYILQESQQQAVRQTFVQRTTCIRLGDIQLTIADLLHKIPLGRSDASQPEDGDNSLPKGQVMRNPETGEIIPF